MIKQTENIGATFNNIMKLRKLMNHPGLVSGPEYYDLQNLFSDNFLEDELEDNSMKFQFVGDFVDKIKLTGEKLILVSYFTQTLDVLEE